MLHHSAGNGAASQISVCRCILGGAVAQWPFHFKSDPKPTGVAIIGGDPGGHGCTAFFQRVEVYLTGDTVPGKSVQVPTVVVFAPFTL